MKVAIGANAVKNDVVPASGPSFARMGSTFQERVVAALINDPSFLDQMVDVLEPDYFDVAVLRALTRRIFEYRGRYKFPPTFEALEMLVVQDQALQLDDLLRHGCVDFLRRARDFALSELPFVKETSLEFCRRQAVIDALGKSLDRVEDKDYESITKLVREALQRGNPRGVGHVYTESVDARRERTVRRPIPTGWGPVDRVLGGGVERGTLSVFVSPTGTGKSMILVNLACSAIERGLNVLYVTLELNEAVIGQRCDAFFSEVPLNDLDGNVDRIRSAIEARVKGELFIQEWPARRASIATIRAHIRHLQAIKNVKLDLVLVDYPALIRGPKNATGDRRMEQEAVYEELRGLGQEEHVAVVGVEQTNRGGLNSEVVTIGDIAECYAKLTVCDAIFTFTRRAEDKDRKVARLHLPKSRFGPDGMTFPVVFDPALVKMTVMEVGSDAEIFEPAPRRDPRERLRELMDGQKNRRKSNDG